MGVAGEYDTYGQFTLRSQSRIVPTTNEPNKKCTASLFLADKKVTEPFSGGVKVKSFIVIEIFHKSRNKYFNGIRIPLS